MCALVLQCEIDSFVYGRIRVQANSGNPLIKIAVAIASIKGLVELAFYDPTWQGFSETAFAQCCRE